MSNFGDIFSLVQRWSRRDRRELQHWQTKYKYPAKRSKGKRSDYESERATYSVKFLGLYAVDGPYDELGCHRALSRRERKKNGHHHSPRVLLSVTSTTIKIIYHHWVAFENAVTAVSTCYTDRGRPRLFAYIMKNYTSGNHFCMAFKTLKRSGLTGARLQEVFGYAFDSCCSVHPPPLLTSEDSSLADDDDDGDESELERCLQICHSTHKWSHIMRSNSNFSAMSDTTVGDPLIRPKSYMSTRAPPVPPRPRGKCVALGKDGHLNLHSIEDRSNHRNSSKFKQGHVQNIAEKPIISTIYTNKVCPKDQSPMSLKCGNKKQGDGYQERETEENKDEKEEGKQKKFPSPKPTLNRCFFCQHPRPTSVSLERCVSDSYLICKVLQLSHFTPADRTTPTKPREQEDGKFSMSRITSSIPKDGVTATQEPPFVLDDAAPSLQNDINSDFLKKMSNNFLPSPLYNSTVDEDRIEKSEESSGDVMVSEHSNWLEEAGQIERQVAYFNLATEDSATTGQSSLTTPTTIAKKCGLSITSSEIDTAFDSEDFVTDLMQKLAQLADSPEDQLSHLLQFPSRPFEPIQTLPTDKQPNSDTLDPISQGENPEAICFNTSPELCASLGTSNSEQNKSEFNPASFSPSSLRMSASLPSSDQATEEAHESSSTSQVHKAASQSKCAVETSVAIKPDEDYSPIAATNTVTGTDEPHPSTNSDESFICVNSSTTTSSNNNNNNQSQPPKTSPFSPENSVVLISTNSPPPSTGSAPTNGTSTASENNQSSVKVARMVASGSSCSQWQVTQEAQTQLSRVLALISPPLVGHRSQGDGDGEAARDGGEDSRSKIATLTCLIATWEPSSDT